MKTKYYWKVVRETSVKGIFKSASVINGIYCLKYSIGLPTLSAMDENGIFVFKTRNQARVFKKDLGNFGGYLRILKVKVFGDEIDINSLSLYDLWELWAGYKLKKLMPVPLGTTSFPVVKPVAMAF